MESMKKYFSVLSTLLLFSTVAKAYDGVVIVLEAPLLKAPNLSSTVLQTLRKGDRVFVPREAFNQEPLPEYIPTFDRVGNRAYIPTRYIKVITNNVDESRMPLTIAGHDPTDYRLPEPIPATYPYEDKNYLRAAVAISMANNTKAPYTYNASFNKQDYQSEIGARLTLMRKVSFDKYDRFYFGFFGSISSSRNNLTFKNANIAEEERSIIRGGPLLTFDVFKSENYRFTVGTGFTYNYHRSAITIESDGDSEQRRFTGFSFSPVANAAFQINDVLPNTDFISGLDFTLYLPHTQKTIDAAEFPELWAEDDSIKSGLKPQASLFMGIQVKY
jgi:hypothetical protein